MPKTLKVTLEIEVDDLPPDADNPEEELPELDAYTAEEAASPLEGLNEDTCGEIFAGTSIGLQYNNCRVISAEWSGNADT